MLKSTVLMVFCVFLFSCEKISVKPEKLDTEGALLKKVVIQDYKTPSLTTIDFSYNKGGKLIKANKIKWISDYGMWENYSIGYYQTPNSYYFQKEDGEVSKRELFGGAITFYSIEETKLSATTVKSYGIDYDTLSGKVNLFISLEDSIKANYPAQTSYNLTSYTKSSSVPLRSEKLELVQNMFTYSDSSNGMKRTYTGTYSNLFNPFQKEVWEIMGITIGSRFMQIASDNIANEYLLFSFKETTLQDGGTYTYEYLYDERGRLRSIDEYYSLAYPTNDGSARVLNQHYSLYY